MNRVDPLTDWGWRLGPSCHLYADAGDSLEELHSFAARLGLKRAWFQRKPGGGLPHYDLTASKRSLAVKLGAVESDRRTMVHAMQGWKTLDAAEVS